MNGWPSTRRFARSLSEAFPDVRACAIEMPAGPTRRQRWLGALLAVAIGAGLTLTVVYL